MKEPKPQGPDADQEHLDQLLDDLYALQKNLLHDEFNKAQELDLPETDTEADFDSLEIPILTQSLNQRGPIPSRHSLWLRLRWYLIIFDPLTFVLD